MDRRRRLLTPAEDNLRGALAGAVAQHDARLFTRQKLSDVLDIRRSGLPDETFEYACKAHLDYVVADADATALFAIELDDSSHRTAEARRRDGLKNAVCARLGLPLLRVGSRLVSRRAVRELIASWLIDVWFAHTDFRASEAPAEEPFIPFSVLARDADGRMRDPLALDAGARARCRRLHRNGSLRHPSAQRRFQHRPDGSLELYAILALRGDRWVAGHVTIDRFEWHGAAVDLGLLALLLADALALREAVERAGQVLSARGRQLDRLAMRPPRYRALKQRTRDWSTIGLVGRGEWQSVVRLPGPTTGPEGAALERRTESIAKVVALRDAIEDVSGMGFSELWERLLGP